MNTNKLFSDFSLKKIWEKLLQHDKAMNSTLLILTSGNWVEQEDGTFTNTVPYSTFKDTDKLTVDLYDDGTITETALSEYEMYIDEFDIVNGALIATANTKPTQTMTIIVKGDFESTEINISDMLRRLDEMESNFTMAASAIGDALVAKEIEVPEGTSLLEMADMIRNANSLSPKVTIYYQIEKDVSNSESVTKGDSILNPTTFTPAKDGWTFTGWREDTIASGTVLQSKVAEKSISLYAVFEQNVTCTFKSYNSTKTASGKRYYNNGTISDASITAPAGATYSGWTWRGWSAAETTTGNAAVSFANGATISGLKANVTYYGLYSSTITATFKSYNTSKDVTGTRYWNAAGNYTNASVKAPTGATYSGWTWRGWSAAGTTTGNASVAYANGATISGLASAKTYYGLYSSTITLSYNGNSPTSGSTTAQTGTRYWNAAGNYINPSFKLSSNGFTKTNYIFKKWAQGSTSGTQYAVGVSVTLTANTTFYAVWGKYVFNKNYISGGITAFTKTGGSGSLGKTTMSAGNYFQITTGWISGQSLGDIIVSSNSFSRGSYTKLHYRIQTYVNSNTTTASRRYKMTVGSKTIDMYPTKGGSWITYEGDIDVSASSLTVKFDVDCGIYGNVSPITGYVRVYEMYLH